MLKFIRKITGKKNRIPAHFGRLVAVPQAIVVWTRDGSIVITPNLARDIARSLPEIIEKAETGFDHDNKPDNSNRLN